MTKTFTHDDVVRYLYNEIPQNEKTRFEEAMICNSTLLNLFHELSATKGKLDEVEITPSDRVIESILDYSRSLNLHSIKK
jgi:hypothetical protein